ncbi:hypothetical protein STEG23_026205 [Scotinomys teguina]
MMSKGGFGSNDSFSGGDGDSGASNHKQARAQDLGLPSTMMSWPGLHSIVPCFISRLLTAIEVDNVFKIRGFVLHWVSIMGMIMEAKKASQYIMYKFDDMTAKGIEGRQLLSLEKTRQPLILLPVEMYAKVVGILHFLVGTTLLGILSILEDRSELPIHILEAINVHKMLDQSCED